MPQVRRSICLLCSLQNNVSTSRASSVSAWQPMQWYPKRTMAQLRRQKTPQRMSLSPRVAQPAVPQVLGAQRSGRHVRGPFAGMNQRFVNARDAQTTRPRPEPTRASRKQPPRQRERGTYHALKMQKSLVEVSYGQRSSIKEKISDVNNFEDLNLLPSITTSVTGDILSGLTDVSPTPIQRLAIPLMLGRRSRSRRRKSLDSTTQDMEQFLLAAETGSGKTLAYLLPILQGIKKAEAVEKSREAEEEAALEQAKEAGDTSVVRPPIPNSGEYSKSARPKAIVLLPTSELVSQVGAVVKKLSHRVKFRSAIISAAYTGNVIRNRVFAPNGIDILISTPRLLDSITKATPNILSRVTHLVIDEADSLLDRSFSPFTTSIIDRSTPSLEQLILCSATIPKSLDAFLHRRFPDMQRLVTPNLHAIPRRVQLGVVDIDKQPYQGNRMLACADTIWNIGKASGLSNDPADESEGKDEKINRLLVFVNEREASQEVAAYLVSKGIDAVALNRDSPEQRQSTVLNEFTSREPSNLPPSSSPALAPQDPKEVTPQSDDENSTTALREWTPQTTNSPVPPPSPSLVRRRLPNTKVLVATDLGSRGIDTLAVKCVILYDVPHTTIDFIHRLGRTGRMGRRGRGVVLVGRKDRKDVVREVRESMYKGQALI